MGRVRMRGRRPGFALFAVILVVAILAVAGTVVTVTLASSNSTRRAQMALDELSLYRLRAEQFRLTYASGNINQNFTKWPGRLSALTAPIIRPSSCVATYCELNTCTVQSFSTADVTTWNSSTTRFGPFLTHRLIEKNYGYPLPGGFGFVSDTIYRATTPPTMFTDHTSGRGQPVWVNIARVESADALELDMLADASDGAAAGVVRWSAAVDGQVTVYYMIAPASAWAGC